MYCAQGEQTAIVRVGDWEDARRIGKLMRRWLFRGQMNEKWLLKSSLERAFESRGISIARTDPIEEMILMDFRSRAHLFTSSVPKHEDTIAWLSLLRHHGGPTRLLDFTESFYVAAYFALDGAVGECAVWAFNRIDYMQKVSGIIDGLCLQFRINPGNSLEQRFDEILRRAIRGEIRRNTILTMGPSQQSERQFLQQGIAMVPLNLQEGFTGAILGSFDSAGKLPLAGQEKEIRFEELKRIIPISKLVKVVITEEAFLDARLDLEQMNINGATLFRELDGLGRYSQDVLNTVEHHLREKQGRTTG
ncbi:MAG TPA: FRG domain-containing protein [Desulfatiglandales bacterium]|nr:FRG domain-containing protein [Desulfatiglandales bacterium]